MKQTILNRPGRVCQWAFTLALIGIGLSAGLPFSARAVDLPSASPTPTVPFLINYQGTLQDGAGVPLATADYELSFSVYSAASGGSLLWGPQKLNGQSGTGLGPRVPVVSGRFNVTLGPVDTAGRSLADVFNQSSTFLEIAVGAAAPISPRQRILPSAYSFNSSLLNGYSWDSLFTGGNPETGTLFVGLDPATAASVENGGTLTPKLDVSGRIRLRQGGFGSAGIWLRQDSIANDRGFMGMASDDEMGFWGTPLGAYGLTMNVTSGVVKTPKGLNTGPGRDAGVNFGQWSDSIFIIGQQLRTYTNRMFSEFHSIGFFNAWYNLVLEAPSQLEVRAPSSTFSGTVSSTGFSTTSDRRLKTEIEQIADPLQILSQINGVSYRFDKESDLAKKTGFELPKGRQVGVLAQEVEKVLPEAVNKDGNGVMSVNYNGLTGVLIEAIKQQQKELDLLRSELKALREQRQQ